MQTKRTKYETVREKELDEEYQDEMTTILALVKDRIYINKKISEHNKYIKKIIENPFEEYEKLEIRIKLYGKEVSFPELEGVITLLLREVINADTTQTILKEQHIIKLTSLLFKSRVFLPYAQTIITISDTLFFFDNIQRTGNDPNPNPFFHTRRNYYYQNMLLNSDCIIFPSIYGIGSTDLIKVRCVPIFFIGVSTRQLFVDEYINTSVEFYFHDIQHARRMNYYNNYYFDTVYKHSNYKVSRSTYDQKNIKQMYKEASEFTKDTILPLLAMENQYHEKLSEEENALMKFNKMIIFEIVHEAAFFIMPDVIIDKILEKDCQTPVESIVKDGVYPNVKNTMYDDPPILANMMYKLQSSFYDTEDDRHDYIVPVKYRFSKYAVISAIKIINWLGLEDENLTEKLEELINMKERRPEPPKGYFITE